MVSEPRDGVTAGGNETRSDQRRAATRRSATVAVIEAVAGAERAGPTELPPLYEAIDPDALDSLFENRDGRSTRGDRRVEFAYAGYDVVVRDGPRVSVRER